MKDRLEPSLGCAKRLFGQVAVVHIEGRRHPARDRAIPVADRDDTAQVKAIGAFLGPDPILELTRGSGRKGLREAPLELVPIVGMHGDEGPLVVERFLFAQAGQLHPASVHPLQTALCVARPDHLG